MSEDSTDNIDEKDEEFEALDSDTDIGDGGEDDVIRVSGMYKEWFLDYASYVILERAGLYRYYRFYLTAAFSRQCCN